jgi:hypothetical protein
LIDQLETSRFALQVDEATDAIKDAYLIIYVQHVLENIMKVKVKLSLCFKSAPHHKSVLGSGGIAQLIL